MPEIPNNFPQTKFSGKYYKIEVKKDGSWVDAERNGQKDCGWLVKDGVGGDQTKMVMLDLKLHHGIDVSGMRVVEEPSN